MGEIIKNVTELADGHGGAWMVVYHEGVATGRARGSTALLGAVDTEIKVEKEPNEDGTHTRFVKLTKSRDGIDGEKWHFEFKRVVMSIDEDGDEVDTVIVSFNTASEKKEKRKKPGGVGKKVLEALSQLTSEFGADRNPGGLGFPDPGRVIVVTVEDLISHAAGKLTYDPEKRDERRKRARQGIEKLSDLGWVQINDGFVWKLP